MVWPHRLGPVRAPGSMTETIPTERVEAPPDNAPAPLPAWTSWRAPWWVSTAGFAAVTALCVWLGYFTMFNSYGGWDDEGDLLISLQAFARHGGLYTHTYSAFGPFYYEAFTTVFRWLPVTVDNGRVVTIVVVLLASFGFGLAVKMFTGNLIAGLATQVGSFISMILSFVDESGHPTSLVWLLFAVALIALALVARGKRSVGFVVLGATMAALVLTEVNVGALAVIAVLFAGLALAPLRGRLRLARPAAAVLFVVTPFLLLKVGGHAAQSWAVKYSVAVALAAAGVVVLTLDRRLQGLVKGRDISRFLLGGGVLTVVSVVIAIISGTRPLDIVRGMFIDTAHYSNIFTIPLVLANWVPVWGAVCLVGAVLYRLYRDRSSAPGVVDAALHVVAGLAMLYIAVTQAQLAPPIPVSFTVALPLLFFAAVPPVGASQSERVARVVLVSLAVLEGLIAYPVAGAQIEWSSLLIIPAGMLCLNDGLRQLRRPLARARLGYRVVAGVVTSALLLSGLGWLASVFVGNLSDETTGYYANVKTTLPGSDKVRLPAPQAAGLESLTHAIRSQCSSLVTLPALNSLYLWTGESLPPDWFNTWFYTSDGPQQEQIVQNVERQGSAGFCVVYSPEWWTFWLQGHRPPELPLLRFVQSFLKTNSPPQVYTGYELFVSRHATS
jgi:hypothetical protein